jgi:putative spermidine/putrescine transport system permease protein
MPEGAAFRTVVAVLAWLGLGFLLFPVVFTFLVSFGGSQFIEFPPAGFSLRWYENIARINRVVDATLVSLGVALLAGVLATVLGAAAALALVRAPIPGKAALTSFLLSPIALPIVAIGIALIQFFILLGVAFTWWSLVIGHLVLVLAYPVRTVAASLTLSNPGLEEAAGSLGATPWQVFRTITLPQMAPGMVSGFLFAFLISFDNYPISIFLVRGDLTTLPIELFNYISQNLDPTPAAFSSVYVAVVAVLIWVAERRFRIVSLSIPR